MNSIVNYISVCIIALFVTLVMITGGIDIQAASIIGLTSIVQGYPRSVPGVNIWAALTVSIAVAAVCGGSSGFFIAYCGVQPMVVTLGGSFLHSGLALLVSGMSATPAYQGISGFPSKAEDGAFVDYRFLGRGELLGVPMRIVIYLALIVLCIWLLHRTKYGERLYLIGVNQQAAEYSGINTRLVILSTYVLSAVSAALAGTILTSNVNSAKYNVGSGYTLAIITAVVLGGTLNTGGKGSILGTVLASLIISHPALRPAPVLRREHAEPGSAHRHRPCAGRPGARNRRPGHDRQGGPHLAKVRRRFLTDAFHGTLFDAP